VPAQAEAHRARLHLRFADVSRDLVARGAPQLSGGAGTVAGFGRYALPDVTYPGMVAERDSHVDGVLYLDVEAGDLPALDRFEATNTAGKRWK